MPKFFGNIFLRKPFFLLVHFGEGTGGEIKRIGLPEHTSESTPYPKIKVQQNADAANALRGIRGNTPPKRVGLTPDTHARPFENNTSPDLSPANTPETLSHAQENGGEWVYTRADGEVKKVTKGPEFGSKWRTDDGALVLDESRISLDTPPETKQNNTHTTGGDFLPDRTAQTPEKQSATSSSNASGSAERNTAALRSFYQENSIPFTEARGENGSVQISTQAALTPDQQGKFNTLLSSINAPLTAAEAPAKANNSSTPESRIPEVSPSQEIPVAVGASPRIPKIQPAGMGSSSDASRQLESTIRERMGVVARSNRESTQMPDLMFHGDDDFTPQIFAPTSEEIRRESALYEQNKAMMPAESGHFIEPTLLNANQPGRNVITGGPDAIGDKHWSSNHSIDPKIHLYADEGHQVPVVFGPKNAAGLRPMYQVMNMSTDGRVDESGIIKNKQSPDSKYARRRIDNAGAYPNGANIDTDLRQQNDVFTVQGGDNKTYFLKPISTVGRLMRNLYNTSAIQPSPLSIPTGEQFQ